MRYVWERKTHLRGWHTKLTWVKSGTVSRVYDTPYEIYEKKYGPTLLSSTTDNLELALGLTSNIRGRTLERRKVLVPLDATVEVKLTFVLGKHITSVAHAKRCYRERNKLMTLHSLRFELMDLPSLTGDLHKRLDMALDRPSQPVYLAFVQVTIRGDEGQDQFLRKPRYAKAKILE